MPDASPPTPTSVRPPANDLNTRMAGERTLLAWIRTGLAMMGFGFVVARFGLFLREIAAVKEIEHLPSTSLSLWIGTTLVLLGVLVNLLAAVQHVRFLQRLERGEPQPITKWPLGVVVAVILALVGAGMAVYLVILPR
jgi:putative membrane protein